MASKLTLRKLELRGSGSGHFWRKTANNSHTLGISLLLACGAGVLLFCFMYIDVRTFYDFNIGNETVLLPRGLGPNSLASHGLEDGLGSRSSPSTQISMESSNGSLTEGVVDDSFEDTEKSVKPFEPNADGIDSATEADDSLVDTKKSVKVFEPNAGGVDSATEPDDSTEDTKKSVTYDELSADGKESADEFFETVKKSVEASEPNAADNDSAVITEEAHDSGLNDDRIESESTHVSEDKDSQSEVLELPGGPETKGRDRRPLAGCDISQGRWVYDDTYPLYRSRNCPFADSGFRCEENGRPDTDFMKYRWQPNDCDLPRFNPKDMLERLRDQRLVFVGDSLGRNQWESMLCMLAEGVQNKSRIYEINGQPISKHVGELIFRFQDYNVTVEYYRDPFLVPQTRPPPNSPTNVTNVLRIDQVSWSVQKWASASILIFNSGHWWSWEKIGRQGGRFQVGDKITSHGHIDAFRITLNTWAKWMERNVDPKITQVFFRSYASVHFRGGSWNTGGHCDGEVKPLTDEEVTEMQKVPWTNKLIKDAIKQNIKTKRSAVEYMDVTTSTNYRADGHSGLFANNVTAKGPTPRNRQDCSHFCLPGVPDTWNELLYATLLARGQGAWGEPARY